MPIIDADRPALAEIEVTPGAASVGAKTLRAIYERELWGVSVESLEQAVSEVFQSMVPLQGP